MQPAQSCLSSPWVLFLLCCPSKAARSRTSPSPGPTGQTLPAPSMEPSETACPPSSTRGAPRRRSGYQQKDSRKHFIPRLSAALSAATGQEHPHRAGPIPMAWPREAGAGCLGLSQKGPLWGHREKGGLLFPENQALVVGWHVHLEEMLWLEKLLREATHAPSPSHLPSSPGAGH